MDSPPPPAALRTVVDAHRALASALGGIDILLLDQVMRGRLEHRPRVLDVACGSGRNSLWLLGSGHDVHGIDADPERIAAFRLAAAELRPDLPAENFRVGAIESADLPAESFDAVLVIALLHFARDAAHFEEMLRATWRPLRPGGLFFCRLATSIGLEGRTTPLGGGRHRLGDGSERFLVDRAALGEWSRRLGGRLLDPVKTTLVEELRAMTTWVMEKLPGAEPARGPGE